MSTSKSAQTPQLPVSLGTPTQVIYADRIYNVAIGPSVSRLTLAMEVAENTVAPNFQLVIPTPALFEALEFMATTITTNDNVKKGLVDGLNTFREKIEKTKT